MSGHLHCPSTTLYTFQYNFDWSQAKVTWQMPKLTGKCSVTGCYREPCPNPTYIALTDLCPNPHTAGTTPSQMIQPKDNEWSTLPARRSQGTQWSWSLVEEGLIFKYLDPGLGTYDTCPPPFTYVLSCMFAINSAYTHQCLEPCTSDLTTTAKANIQNHQGPHDRACGQAMKIS